MAAPPARRIGHGAGRRRPRAVGRRGTARRIGAGLPEGPGARDPRRGVLPARPRDRAFARAGGDAPAARAHWRRHRPPAPYRRARRPDPDPRGRPCGRARPARRPPARPRVAVCAAAAGRDDGGAGMRPIMVVLRLARFNARYFVANTCFAILVYFILPIPLGLATRAFFDAIAGTSTGLSVWSAIALLVAVELIEVFAGPLLGNPWSPLQQKAQVLMQRNLFAGILRGYGHHGLLASVGETISRFRDDPEIIADALDAVGDLIGRTCFAAGAAVVMWRVNPAITAALFVPLLLSAFLAEALGNRIMAYRAASREATGRFIGFLGELIGAQLAVTVAGAADHAIARLVELGDTRRRLAVRDSVFGQMLEALNINIVHLGTGLVLLLGASAIGTGKVTVGDLALFVVYLDQLTWYPAEIGRLISDLKRIEVSFGRMQAIVPGEPPGALVAPAPVYLRGDPADLPVPGQHVPPRERLERLEVRGLSYAHPGGSGGDRPPAAR